MITFGQLAVWETIIMSLISLIAFGGALYVWRLNRLEQHSIDGRIKDDMRVAERMRARQEAQQAAVQRAGGMK